MIRSALASGRRAVAVLAVALGLACAPEPDAPPPAAPAAPGVAERVLLIGLDGANWPVLDAMLAMGRMPWLAGLLESGSAGVLRSEEPTISPALWTTILTGRSPDSHGIRGFEGRDPLLQTMAPARSSMRQVPALWTYLDHFDRKVGIAGAHVTWPAEPVDGFIVTRRVSETGFSHTTHPAALALEAEAVDLDAFEDLLVAPGYLHPRDGDHRHDFMRRFWITDHAAFRLGVREAGRVSPDLLFVYFHLPDAAQHAFWPPRGTPPVRGPFLRWLFSLDQRMGRALGWLPGLDGLVRRSEFEPIYRVYEHVDAQLAALAADYVTPATATVIVSDHGATGTGIAMLYERDSERLLEALGYLVFERASDPPVVDGARSRLVLGPQTLQEVRFWVNRQHPELADPADRAALAARATQRLRGLVTRAGTPVFRDVVPDPNEPDVVVATIGVAEEDVDQVIVIGDRTLRLGDVYRPAPLGGGHTLEGVIVAAGPPFRVTPGLLGASPAFHIRDVTPTVLAALGLPVSRDFEGRVLEELLRPEVRATLDLAPRDVALDWSPFEPEGIAEQTAIPDRELEALRALGYTQ